MKDKLYSIERKVKIKPSDTCICGSGLKYKECCSNKNVNYKTLGINSDGREIIFNSTELNMLYDEISKFLINNIIDKELSVTKGKEYLTSLFNKGENGTSSFRNYASCKKGCSSCCYIYMDCTAIEAELIREYVLENFSHEQILNLQNKIKASVALMPNFQCVEDAEEKNSLSKKYLEQNVPCIFLSNENTCLIYDVRPYNCRKLISFSEKTECSIGENIVKPNISIDNIVSYAINHLSMNVTRYKKMKREGNYEKEQSSIYKSLQHWFSNGFDDINRDL